MLTCFTFAAEEKKFVNTNQNGKNITNADYISAEGYKINTTTAFTLAKGIDTHYANTFLGAGAGNTTATRQTAIGYGAGSSNGNLGTAMGYYSSYDSTGNYVTSMGYKSGMENKGAYSTLLGHWTGYQNEGNFTTAFGAQSADTNSGNYLTAMGIDVVYISCIEPVAKVQLPVDQSAVVLTVS